MQRCPLLAQFLALSDLGQAFPTCIPLRRAAGHQACCSAHTQLCPIATPATTGRQRVPSRLREELLRRGPAGSKAAATLSTSTSTAATKYPVEASPIPSNDDVVLGKAHKTDVGGLTPSPGRHRLAVATLVLHCSGQCRVGAAQLGLTPVSPPQG